MDIFCRNLPVHLKHRRFKKELKPILAELGIVTFECRLHGRGHATLTILDIQKARQLLNKYPKVPKGKKISPSQGLTILGTTIFIEEGRNKPDPYLLLSLQEDEEESKRRNQEARLPTSVAGSGYGNQQRQRKFYIYSLSCGTFEFAGERPLFVERWSLKNPGQISFGRNKLTVTVQSPLDPQRTYRLDFEYYIINGCIYLGDQKAPSVTFMTASAPHLYDVPPKTQSLSFFNMRTRHEREEKKKRLSYFDLEHKHVIPTSFTYRLMLTDPHDLGQIRGLSNDRHMPQMDRWRDVLRRDSIPYSFQLGRFLLTLKEQDLPFAVKYQLQRLVWNGELSVSKVGALFPYIHDILSRRSPPFVSKLLMALPKKIHPLSPHADSLEVGLRRIVDILSELEKGQLLDLVQPGQPGYLPQNQTDIHRASVTPTGIYLYGPYAEIQNRVLRRFSQYSDYFLRVEFIEETGDVMNYDINSNLDGIFNDRFREILRDGIIIAERHFRFLGFSHSSLRARTCWFMAEFYQNEEPVTTENLIPKLGNFQHIVSPAKFAARIGQTFSDTLSSIPIDREFVEIIPDVERNGRVFSDGCGTISKEILYRIYRDYPRRAPVRPTVFQIRLSGAKGMLSLDSRLIGPKIRLRKSMIKFYANDTNIEICGSGITKLPCYLNAQLIKILEDLGVARDVFMELQRQEVKSLREAVRSPTQAAMFLEHSYIARSTRLPWLISLLKEMGLHHTQDKFLKQAVELAILVRLRDLKYRSRIRVPKAVTLYGIMDETGILKEGQVFVPVLVDNHREILVRDKVVITRSPALHPGDVQLVNAVDVPEDSPLRRLHTCVVFSQHGPRDLPSQLSGGDLDGDIFNIIYDDRFVLHRTAPAADYPRGKDVTLDRPVTIDDVADFFVTFMRQDQLGRIATTHKILADQRASGTFDPDCLTLAELHSTAVDFSKTGTPVDITRIPRYPPYRPDFMAPGPRVQVAENIDLLQDEAEHMWDDLNDPDDDDDGNRPGLRYYKSQRVLGHLYRAIDETEFLSDLQSVQKGRASINLLTTLWQYVERRTAGFFWDHYKDVGYDVKEIYEDGLQELMYQYSDKPWKTSLTEIEVFIGNIMGENHKQTVRQRVSSRSMREDYDHLVDWTMSLITGRGSEDESESLERSIACFWVATHETSSGYSSTEKLRSFAWIAAVICLQEVEKLQKTILYL